MYTYFHRYCLPILYAQGIVPCWMDLKYLQVWVGDTPLGCFNEATNMQYYVKLRAQWHRYPPGINHSRSAMQYTINEANTHIYIYIYI